MSKTALVLSGGGVRGAYEVGVVDGVLEVLGASRSDRSPFQIFAGTSVGAINTAWLAANAHRGDLDIGGLIRLYRELKLVAELKVRTLPLLGWRGPKRAKARKMTGRQQDHQRTALLDPEPLDRIVGTQIDWNRLHDNVAADLVKAVVVAALHVESGRTTMFAELAPGAEFRPSRDPRRVARVGKLGPEHILASAAVPLLFPARRIKGGYYCDGGLRFNTPLAPAIRSGADKLMVISVRYPPERSRSPFAEEPVSIEQFESISFLLGKIFNALLLDPIEYDLHVLERFNALMEVLEEEVPDETMANVHKVLVETRGMSYRTLETLVFHPSQDLGRLGYNYVRENKLDLGGGLSGRLKRRALRSMINSESDLGSFLLFEGGFAQELMKLGRHDALAKAEEIQTFFGS